MLETLLTPLIGFGLTLVIFSYLIHDNPVFRFAVNFLAGLSLTYAVLVVIANVLIPRVVTPWLQFLSNGDPGLALISIVPLVFGAFILFKLSPRWAPLGNWGMAVLVGVGAGVAVGGAVMGTLFGLVDASANWATGPDDLAPLLGLLALLSTVTVLLYFWYTGRADQPGDSRPAAVRVLARVGQAFLMVTFGALFGGVLVSGVATLVERLDLLAQLITLFTTR
jgi:hypothetical protein